MLRPVLLVLTLLAAGCAGPPSTGAEDAPPAPASGAPLGGTLLAMPGRAPRLLDDPTTLRFGPAVPLTPDGHSFEPGIEVAPDGTVYVTAPPPQARPHERSRPSSHAWFSQDDGATWQPLPSPLQAHEWMPGLEGDLALDGLGRLYLVDTYGSDNSLSRWNPGPRWDYSRPILGSSGPDDRPWLAAHGDGILYYLGNGGLALPSPGGAAASDPAAASSQWLYVSTDAGLRWTPGRGFDGSGLCNLAASPADDHTVVVGCRHATGAALSRGPDASVVHVSRDRGATWTSTVLADYEHGMMNLYPSVAFDAAGAAYFAWNDGDPASGAATRLFVARDRADGAWEVLDVTPFQGTFERVWLAGGAHGAVGLAFYATRDAKPSDASEWHAYAMVSQVAAAPETRWTFAPVDAEPVWRGAESPGDFLQAAMAPDGALHVVYQRDTAPPEPEGAPVTFGGPSGALHARQILGAAPSP